MPRSQISESETRTSIFWSRSKKISQTLVTLIETKNPAVCCVTFCICSDQDCSFVFVFKNDQSQRFQFLFTNDEVEADLSWKMEMKCQDFITLVCTNKQSVINWYRYIIIRSGQLEKKWSNNKWGLSLTQLRFLIFYLQCSAIGGRKK